MQYDIILGRKKNSKKYKLEKHDKFICMILHQWFKTKRVKMFKTDKFYKTF